VVGPPVMVRRAAAGDMMEGTFGFGRHGFRRLRD
jgi:hypothetical protein